MSQTLNIIVVGSSGDGKSSVINLLIGKYVATTSNGAAVCTKESITHTLYHCGIDIIFTDTGGHVEKIINENIIKCYNILLFVMKPGVLLESHTAIFKFAKYLLPDIPIIVVMTHCEKFEPINKWSDDNKERLMEFFKPVSIVSISAGDNCPTTMKESSRTRLMESILYHKNTIYHTINEQNNLIFSSSIVTIKHKNTGLYLGLTQNILGYYFARLQISATSFSLLNPNVRHIMTPIKNNHKTILCDKLEKCDAIYETGYSSWVSFKHFSIALIDFYKKSDSIWIFKSNNDVLKYGSEVVISNSLSNKNMTVNNDLWITCNQANDIWILERA